MTAVHTIRIWHGDPGWDIYREKAPEMKQVMGALRGTPADVSAQDTRIGGLEKAQEIAIYHRDKYGERADKAWVAACNEIIVSCAATANRIKRGEYENPTSSVMSTQVTHE
jgi:hypothetical protein